MPLKGRIGFTIANGASLSASVQVNGERIQVVEMPSAWTAAGLSFQGSPDNSNFFDLWDETGEFTLAVDASRRIQINSDTLSQQAYLKVRSGTSAAPVNQGAERKLYLEIWE